MNGICGIDRQGGMVGTGLHVSQCVALGYLCAGALPLQSANGAASCQPGASPREHRTPQNSGLKARAIPRADGPGFQPLWICETVTQGVAMGWYEAGALPLTTTPTAAWDAESAEVLGNSKTLL